jgi:hypothetical protein
VCQVCDHLANEGNIQRVLEVEEIDIDDSECVVDSDRWSQPAR